MVKVGLTGGIGSGKTYVSKIFYHLGIPVFNADLEAARIINSNEDIIVALKNKFGNDIYKYGKLDKKKVASIVFNDKNALEFLNKTTHPPVIEYYKKWLSIHKNASYTIKETAILFESNSYKKLDFTISVFAPQELRIKRVVQRDNVSEDKVLERVKNQMSDELKIELSDFVIYNNGKEALLPQVVDLNNKIISLIK